MGDHIYVTIRGLLRAPAYTFGVVLTLGIGIGAASAIYSMVAWSLFPEYGFRDAEQLVKIEVRRRDSVYKRSLSESEFLAVRQNAACFTSVAAARYKAENAVLDNEPVGVRVAEITESYFSTLGVAMFLGRYFREGDLATYTQGAVITYGFWKSHMSGDSSVLGRSVTIGQDRYQIIGVLARNYRAPETVFGDLYILFRPSWKIPDSPDNRLFCFGRLVNGLTLKQASDQLVGVVGAGQTAFIPSQSPLGVSLLPINFVQLPPELLLSRRLYWSALVAVLILYLIGLLNAGSLFLTRTLSRAPELAVRLAIGSSRLSLVGLVAIEGALLSAIAICVGLILSQWLFPLLIAIIPLGGHEMVAPIQQPDINWFLVKALVVIAVVTVMSISLVPVLVVTSSSFASLLKVNSHLLGVSRQARTTQKALIVAEIALAVVLLAGAALMLSAFNSITHIPVGYDSAGKYIVEIDWPPNLGYLSPEANNRRSESIVNAIATVPGIEAADQGDAIPRFYFPTRIEILRHRGESAEVSAQVEYIGAKYISILGLPVLLGHGLDGLTINDPAVAVINQTTARLYFSGENPVGQYIRVARRIEAQVVGVVGDVRTPREAGRPYVYLPNWVGPSAASLSVLVKASALSVAQLETAIRHAVFRVDAGAAVTRVYELKTIARDVTYNQRFIATALDILASFSLLLSMGGVYGLVGYIVVRRRAEFGLRMALGASPWQVYISVVRDGIGAACVGIVIGSVAAGAAARLLSSALRYVEPFNFGVYVLTGFVVLIAVAFAIVVPSIRAASVEPVELLRCL